jgi:transcriptional regulator with XRE-family HTH domain
MNDISAALVGRLRELAGLTQSELARRSGTSQPAIARLEAGYGSPGIATLQRLAEAAGFDLELRLAPRASADPVIARYGKDIDRTLLRRNLTLSVDQRIRELARLQEFDAEVRRAGREARRDRGRRR